MTAERRLDVAKTYKLFVGGAFPRSESGRSYPVHTADGHLLAHAALASRKDLRDAVTAARAALSGWSGATACNRGQVGEVLATSDVPAGVANLLTGQVAELAPWLASHAEVAGLDLAGAPAELAVELERAAADTVTRVLPRPPTEPDSRRTPGLARLRAWSEIRTVWHPVGR